MPAEIVEIRDERYLLSEVVANRAMRDHGGGGTYIIRDETQTVVYVGQTARPIRDRLKQHKHCGTAGLVEGQDLSLWTVEFSLESEVALVAQHQPKHNVQFNHGIGTRRGSGGRSALIGQWFHSFHPDGHLRWQGQVLSAVKGDKFLVQLYEWATGCEGDRRLVATEMMCDWSFYAKSEDMRTGYQKASFR